MPPPTPPRVNDGRITTGKPNRSTSFNASSKDRAYALSGTSMPIDSIAPRNSSRSSATRIASREAPISLTSSSSSTPLSPSSIARLRAVCPPTVGSSASGFSFSMTDRAYSRVSGST